MTNNRHNGQNFIPVGKLFKWFGKGLKTVNKGLNVGEDLVRVRHHTNKQSLKVIKNSKLINPSRGEPYGVDFEVEPFLPPSQVNLGQFNKGAYVEFSVPRSSIITPPGFMGGTGNAGRYVTGKSRLDISNMNPKFKVWKWWEIW